MSANPLLYTQGLPDFERIQAQHIMPALQEVIDSARQQTTQLTELQNPDWENFAQIIEDLEERLSRLWSPVEQLNAVKNNADFTKAYQQGIQLLTEYQSEFSQNIGLYTQYKKIRQQADFAQLNKAQQKVIDNALLDFSLNGAELEPQQQQQLKAINLKLAELGNQFEQNLLEATQAWHYWVDDIAELKGMPESNLQQAKQLAKEKDPERDGWLISIQLPSYLSVMQYVENAELRETVYRAYSTRASELSDDAKFDNAPLIDEILQLRSDKAALLGFNNYAELSLVKKMANSSEQVIEFLSELASHAKPVAEQQLTELRDFAKQNYGIDKLNAWDLSFYSERLREQQYAFSNEQVKAYFPAPQVLDGLFNIVQTLFGISIKVNADLPRWHDDVSSFDVFDQQQQLLGQFYTDLYTRNNKRGGAWMGSCLERHDIGHHKGQDKQAQIQTPVAFLNCNFSRPVGEQPALLTHDEVETLFHEFGHTLHHLLSTVDYISVSGINGVAWDAVELPSQFLENWCWQEQSILLFAKHYLTGEAIPQSLLTKMRAAKNFQSGMQTLRQIEFALFDMLLHSRYQADKQRVQQLLDQVRQQVALITPPEFNRFQNSFSHIFAGGYAAGYYSYKWAEVLSADAFSRFDEDGIFNRDTGQAFKQAILERGGVDDAAQLFKDFRGREPQIEPLLKQTGIMQSQ